MSTAEAPRLRCGADLGAIVRQVTDDAPAQDAEHQVACPFCQAALASVRRVTADVRELADEHIPVPRSFGAGIMRRLEEERRAVDVGDGPAGQTLVAERLVARVAREAAGSVAGVIYASAGADSAVTGPDDYRVLIRIRLVVALGRSLPAVADEVRARVADEVERITGLHARPIEVLVEDVLD